MNKATTKAAYEIEVGDYKCQLSAPTRQILKIVYGKMMKADGSLDLIEGGEIMLNSCWVNGDKEIKENDLLFVSACMSAVGLIELKEAKLKKL
jgi:hypothetical protein